MCGPGSRFFRLVCPIAVLVATAPLSTVDARAARKNAPLAITSPTAGFTTSGDLVQVGVTFRAATDGQGTPKGPLPDTIVLLADGVEVGRLSAPGTFSELTHIFTVDLSTHTNGAVTFLAQAARRKSVASTSLIVIERSAKVTIRLDRILSDGVDVGPAGAALISDDGALTLAIPQNALARTERISVRKLDVSAVPPLPNDASPLAAYELQPHDLQFAQDVTVSLSLDQSGRTGDGSFGHEVVELFSISDDLVEGLDGQSVVVDGTTGHVGVTGTMRHFSTLTGAVTNQFRVRISGVPETVRVGDAFDVAVQAGDELAGTLSDFVVLEEVQLGSEPIVRTGPDPTQPAVRLGFFEQDVANDHELTLTYQCTRPGFAVFNVVVRAESGFPRINLAKFMFCSTEDMLDGVVSSPAGGTFEARVEPVDSVHALNAPFTVRLSESAASAGNDVMNITIFDLVPGTLEGPSLSPTETADLLSAGPITQVTEPLQSGLAEQELGYECRNAGTTVLGLRFSFPGGSELWLQARVQCQP
jgi:hypothetical protein